MEYVRFSTVRAFPIFIALHCNGSVSVSFVLLPVGRAARAPNPTFHAYAPFQVLTTFVATKVVVYTGPPADSRRQTLLFHLFSIRLVIFLLKTSKCRSLVNATIIMIMVIQRSVISEASRSWNAPSPKWLPSCAKEEKKNKLLQ